MKAAPTAPNPNPAINGWCRRCKQFAVRSRQDTCMFCDRKLVRGPEDDRPLVPLRRGRRSA